jgi:hypothetical protein
MSSSIHGCCKCRTNPRSCADSQQALFDTRYRAIHRQKRPELLVHVRNVKRAFSAMIKSYVNIELSFASAKNAKERTKMSLAHQLPNRWH